MGVDGHASAIKFDGYVFVTVVGYSHPGLTISLREFIIYLDEVYLVIGVSRSFTASIRHCR
jgi:hypothetical protein